VGGVLQVLGGCARAHLPDVAPELVSESETRSQAFFCNCSRCSLRSFVGAVTTVVMTWAWSRARNLGRRDRYDRSIKIALRLCRFARCGNQGDAVACCCFAGSHARVSESLADTAGPAPKMKSEACPFLNRASSAGSGLCFQFASFLPRACPLSSEFLRLHIAAAACVPSSPETSPA
jgi:hypothetical protein